MGEWLPIESAPRDGTYVLLSTGDPVPFLAFWNGRSWDDGDFYDNLDFPITHWMPLPQPPAA